MLKDAILTEQNVTL